MSSTSHTPFPDPVVFPPTSGNHTSTCVLLHGLGDNGRDFAGNEAGGLLDSPASPSGETFHSFFPDTKFIFPTAKIREVVSLRGAKTRAWFNKAGFGRPYDREEIQVEGLREASEYLRSILKEESRLVGGNVLLGGISQGAATSLQTLMTLGSEEKIKGVAGMCSYFPFCREILTADKEYSDGNDKDRLEAINHMRGLHGLPALDSINDAPLDTPIFLVHGDRDQTIPVIFAVEGMEKLKDLGFDVKLRVYEDLPHWVDDRSLEDVVKFMRKCLD